MAAIRSGSSVVHLHPVAGTPALSAMAAPVLASSFVFNSNTVLILVALIGQIGAIVVVTIQTRRTNQTVHEVHEEVKSPNGSTTGSAVNDIKDEMSDLTRGMAYVTKVVGEHLQDVEPLERWVRQRMREGEHGSQQQGRS